MSLNLFHIPEFLQCFYNFSVLCLICQSTYRECQVALIIPPDLLQTLTLLFPKRQWERQEKIVDADSSQPTTASSPNPWSMQSVLLQLAFIRHFSVKSAYWIREATFRSYLVKGGLR